MASIIIDTNIVFSLLFHLRDIFFDSKHVFYSPNFLFLEIFRLKEKIVKFSKLDHGEFVEMFSIVFEKIIFIGREYISDENRFKALSICKTVDPSDSPFVALALQLNGELWTGDEKLKAGLIRNNFSSFFQND